MIADQLIIHWFVFPTAVFSIRMTAIFCFFHFILLASDKNLRFCLLCFSDILMRNEGTQELQLKKNEAVFILLFVGNQFVCAF